MVHETKNFKRLLKAVQQMKAIQRGETAFDKQARFSSLFSMKTATLSVGAFEAKNRFSDLIDRVGRGAEITITKHDKPVAKLVPAANALGEKRRRAAAELRALRGRYRLKGVAARELIAEGRR